MSSRIRIAGGKAAIWTGAGDTLPFDNPNGNLARVKFHSDLQYIKIIDTRTFNVTLPSFVSPYERVADYTLYAHGRPGQPYVLGQVNVNGVPAGFTGSVPVAFGVLTGGPAVAGKPGIFGRWLTLGADATNVIVHEYSVLGLGEVMSAVTIAVTVFMTDEILE